MRSSLINKASNCLESLLLNSCPPPIQRLIRWQRLTPKDRILCEDSESGKRSSWCKKSVPVAAPIRVVKVQPSSTFSAQQVYLPVWVVVEWSIVHVNAG